jgi:hypothetical protein
MTNPANSDSSLKSISSQLIGVWKLVNYIEEREGHEDIRPFGPKPEGFLIYTPDGFVSAQLQKPGRAAFRSPDWKKATPEEYTESASGYLGYSGTYEVDEANQTVTHIPAIALPPNFINQKQLRMITFNENRLTLRTPAVTDANGVSFTSRLDWVRQRIHEINSNRAH